MTITTTQKIIKIGTSKGVTLPARELKKLGSDVGDEIEIIVRKKNNFAEDQKVLDVANDILRRYKKDFTNLANR